MGDYQRFVAYVYEYLKGKKEKNCGFVKVEVREGVCSMELKLQCPGLAPDTECRVYGFVRKKEALEGIFLGDCRTEPGTVSCRIRTQAENLSGTGVGLSQLGGMVFVTELGAFFGTEWDDRQIHPEDFRAKEKEEQENKGTGVGLSQLGGMVFVTELGAFFGTEWDDRQIHPEDFRAKEKEEQENKQEEERDIEEREDAVEEGEAGPGNPDDVQESIQQDNQDAGKDVSEMRAEEILEEKEAEENPPFIPFSDGEFEVCKKIKPQDLLGFSRRECALRHNRFLAYGYYNFGHLLLGKRADGRYILGVPGRYDQQEQFMAGMFGFPYFKESSSIRLSQGCGGYWYRLINAPDADGGNGF